MPLPTPKRRNISPAERLQIAEDLHIAALSALFSVPHWSAKDVCFQGGTSLHLAWQSPRYSEDLDFLLREDFDPELLRKTIDRSAKAADAMMLLHHPGGRVVSVDRRKETRTLQAFELKWTHPQLLETVMVKIEFWPVQRCALSAYRSVVAPMAMPFQRFAGAVSARIPVGELDALMGDKLVAIGLRRPMKWRDFYDLDWIASQTGQEEASIDAVRASLAMYDADEAELASGLREVAQMPVSIMAKAADKGLKPWLPPSVWAALGKDGVAHIVARVQSFAEDLADRLLPTSRPKP